MPVEDFPSCPEFLERFDGQDTGCLVLDLHLPVMSGLEFMERYGSRLKDMPVILITGRGDPATKARALEAGVIAFIEKPFDDERLVDLIRTALSRKTPKLLLRRPAIDGPLVGRPSLLGERRQHGRSVEQRGD